MSLDALIDEAMATAARINDICNKIEAREASKRVPTSTPRFKRAA
jgi:hypothetical protein